MSDTRDIVERLRNVRQATRWTRGLDADYPVAWEPDPLCAEAADEITRLRAEAANLRTVMVAAAEEIAAHWEAHCDAEGYGPVNLQRRLEEGIPSEYGYTAGAFAELKAERDHLRAALAQPAEPGWQPIETAPRGSGEDGPSDVRHPDYVAPPDLLLKHADGIAVGYYEWYYHPGYGRGADPDEPVWRSRPDHSGLHQVTHWAPLPAAPQAPQPGAQDA